MLKKLLTKQKAKAKLDQCFRSAEIVTKWKQGSKTYTYTPIIHDIKLEKYKQRYVFTLRNGMDPKELTKKEYVFKQVFGNNIRITGEIKKFVLTVYDKDPFPESVTYDYQEVYEFVNKSKLPIICGINENGKWVYYDMVGENRANIGIFGEPGAGKSTQLRQILCTLIKTLPPEKLRFHLADLKRSEFHIFRNIKHVDGVYTDVENLEKALKKIDKEIDRRGNMLDTSEATHIDELSDSLPYIVICIDEYSLLAEEKEINKLVNKVGSLGRALGIYLIISMQRPSHDLLPTKIRSLLSTRMGFRVADRSNASIAGTKGSEEITRAGRMICRIEKAEEMQAPFLKIEEAKKLLNNYKLSKEEIAEREEEEAPQEEQEEELSEETITMNLEPEGDEDEIER